MYRTASRLLLAVKVGFWLIRVPFLVALSAC